MWVLCFVTAQLDKFRCCSEWTCSDICSVCLSATSVSLRSLASTSSLVQVNCIWRSAWRIWRRTMPGSPSKFLTPLCLTVKLSVRSRPWPAWPSPPTNTTGSSWGLHQCPMVWRKPLTGWVSYHAVLAVHCLCWCSTVLKDSSFNPTRVCDGDWKGAVKHEPVTCAKTSIFKRICSKMWLCFLGCVLVQYVCLFSFLFA